MPRLNGLCGARLCIDFTYINKAYPKDSFPLPRIDLIVDATAGHELLSFIDAFSGYNQISMDPKLIILFQSELGWRVLELLGWSADSVRTPLQKQETKRIGGGSLVASPMAKLVLSGGREDQLLRE